MTMHFVTHFNSTYRAQGVCMLNSLSRHAKSEEHRQHLVWCDEKAPFALLIVDSEAHSMTEMRSWSRLEPLKESRSRSAWFWSLEPAIVDHFLSILDYGDILVYLDADQFFFQDPIREIRRALPGNDSIPLSCGPSIVALSPHYFPEGKEKPSAGTFNFGFGCFRVCDETRDLVSEWLDQVVDQCDEARNDQHYLNEWPEKLGYRLAMLPRGINCGPWSLPEIIPSPRDDSPLLVTGECDPIHAKGTHGKVSFGGVEIGEVTSWTADSERGLTTTPLISAHFHEYRRGFGSNQVTLKGEVWNRSHYNLHPSTIRHVYQVYEQSLVKYL